MIKSTLLIVDDEVINIDILIETLGNGYAVRVATNGSDALKSVAKALPDLILLDVMMPDMDGFEVCRRLKEDPVSREIPIIFLTALNETASKVAGFSAGGVDYVTKPFQIEEINARVEAHLELRRQKHKLQQSYDKLRELETLRDSLVHMIVHDMRSPLTIILSNLELAKMQPLPERADKCIGSAITGAETLLTMVSTLLDISKMESGQMTMEFSTVNMQEIAGETIRMVAPLQGQRRLILDIAEEVAPFTGDADLIRRVLQNLIGNALKFTDGKTGVITVRIETLVEGKVLVSVMDNGPGIPPEYREKVFDKFCQVETRQQGHMHSTGLGLTFCKLAVEAHGGRIGLESAVGEGSTFWFELPRR